MFLWGLFPGVALSPTWPISEDVFADRITLEQNAGMNEELQISSVEAQSPNSGSTAVVPGPLQPDCIFFACPAAARPITFYDKILIQ